MAEKQTFILGLIGGVGAGKSTVLTLLKDHYGFYVIQTDLTARRLLEPGEAAFEEISALFGRDILRPDGRIDRALIPSSLRLRWAPACALPLRSPRLLMRW